MPSAEPRQNAVAAVEALRAGNVREAEAHAKKALMLQPGAPLASEVLGLICLNEGRFDEALEILKAALDETPESAALLLLTGKAFAGLARYKSAVIYFRQAVQAAPDDAGAWEHLGKATYKLRRWQHARGAFEHCLELDPSNADAGAGLARIELLEKNYTRAMELASDVVMAHPGHVMARQTMAEANMRLGNYEQAMTGALAITKMPNARDKMNVIAFGIAAEAAEAQGRFDEAFAHFSAMNNAVAQAYRRGYERANVRESNDKLRGIADLGPELARRSKDWRTEVTVPPTIYYIGFVNSGMSLFTNIMLRHPLIVDGRNRKAVRAWEELVWPEDAVDRVKAITFEDVENLRRGFIATFGEANIEMRPGQIMFDQRPFYSRVMTTLALILPDAKYVLGHRDPRDVIIECFKHRSSPNLSMYEFLDIERAARYYDAAMETAIRARDDYGIEIIELGYDDLIADPEGETRRVLKALGIAWDDALYGQGGQELTLGRTKPSGGWREYEAHLAPAMPILEKWIKYFGYE